MEEAILEPPTFPYTREELRRRLGNSDFYAGRRLLQAGAVRALESDGVTLQGTLEDYSTYTVRVAIDLSEVKSNCLCFRAAHGRVCRHAAALLVASLKEEPDWRTIGERRTSAAEPNPEPPRMPAPERPDDHPVAEAFDAIDELRYALRRHGGWITHGEVGRFYGQVGRCIARIGPELNATTADSIADSLEELFRELQEFVSMLGTKGKMGWMLSRLVDLHLGAYRISSAAAARLASHLLAIRTLVPFTAGGGTLERYASAVPGIASVIETQRTLPPPPKNAGRGERWSDFRTKVPSPAPAPAPLAPPAAAAIVAKARHGMGLWSRVSQFIREYNSEFAFELACRGVERFGFLESRQLTKFYIDELLRRGRHAEAIAPLRAEYEARPSYDEFEELKGVALVANQWPSTRASVIDALRRKCGEPGALDPAEYHSPASALVGLLLREKMIEEAWAAALDFGCQDQQLIEIAGLRESSAPEDSLSVYQARLEQVLDERGPGFTDRAAPMVERIRHLCGEIGGPDAATRYFDELMRSHLDDRGFRSALKRVLSSVRSPDEPPEEEIEN
jgi:hypothetical protein